MWKKPQPILSFFESSKALFMLSEPVLALSWSSLNEKLKKMAQKMSFLPLFDYLDEPKGLQVDLDLFRRKLLSPNIEIESLYL